MSDIIKFNFNDHELEVAYGSNGELLFHANTICTILGFGNPRQALTTHVDADDVHKLDAPTNGGIQQVNYVNESGLYALTLGCTKPQDHTVRVVLDDDNQPMFVAKDVADILGYADTRKAISAHCKGEQKYHPLETNGGMQSTRVIYEPDLYRLIFGSKLPSAFNI